MKMDTETESLDAIAIIGMACRFPGAVTPDSFWRNLCEGVESISRFSDDELQREGIDPSLIARPGYVKAKGALTGIDLFDAAFFGVSPREAEMMDPQHRLFLECAWEAFEDAGIEPGRKGDRTGVFAGVGLNSYLLRNLLSNPERTLADGFFPIAIGNDKDFLPTRVSYKLNLTGPSVNVNTACSTSLTAVQLACQSLLSFQCDMALAGAATVSVPEKDGYQFSEGGILSPDGHCRAFDAAAHGTVPGNGVGVVLLKRLEDAIQDGDPIHAIIRGAAINNDGGDKIGFTAPSISGQSAVILEALELAGVGPDTIGYVEAHGTGTVLGDPIEIQALTLAFHQKTGKQAYCAIGSVKTNLGHLDAAAGMAGLLKTILALKHGLIPPSLHFEKPNPAVHFSGSPFFVNTRLTPWPDLGESRRAGLSSFGIGGTNVHLVLEQAPQENPKGHRASTAPYLLLLSARSETALSQSASQLAGYLGTHSGIDLGSVAWTLASGRRSFGVRTAIICRDVTSAIAALRKATPGSLLENCGGADSANSQRLRVLGAAAREWLSGASVDWSGQLENPRPKRVSLPTYPFERIRCWVDAARGTITESLPAARKSAVESCYLPSWTRSVPSALSNEPRTWLLIGGDSEPVQSVRSQLRSSGEVRICDTVASVIQEAVLNLPAGSAVTCVLLSACRPGGGMQSGVAGFDASLEAGYFVLLQIAQLLSDRVHHHPSIEVIWVSNELHAVTGFENGCVDAATALGLLKVIPQEFSQISCRHLDLEKGTSGARIAAELLAIDKPPVVCIRGTHRWTPSLEPYRPTVQQAPFKREGHYLITGGLGGLGFQFAQFLSSRFDARIGLVGRSQPDDVTKLTARWAHEAEVSAIERQISSRLAIVDLKDRPGLEDGLDRLCSALAVDWLKNSGLALEQTFSRSGLLQQLRVIPKFTKFAEFLLRMLVEDGYIEIQSGSGLLIFTQAFHRPTDSAALAVELRQKHPGFSAQIDLLLHCASNYVAALTGGIEAISVLYPEGGEGLMKKAGALTDEHTHHRVYHLLLQQIVERLLAASDGRTIRILEVGGGNGFLTSLIAPALRDRNVEYVFTDLGKSFVLAVQQKARELGASNFRTAVLDITLDPIEQGFEPDHFDLIFGLDVIHATRDIRVTLAQLQKTLAPGGLICAIETTRGYRWNEMIWGLAEGWWYFEDLDLRDRGTPLMALDRWETACRDAGFEEVATFPVDPAERRRRNSGLVLGRKLDTPGGRLQRLKACGARVEYHAANVADEAQMKEVLHRARSGNGPIHGVIHAAASPVRTAIPLQTRELVLEELHPKARGARILVDLLRDDRDLDFLLLCSSMSSILGGVGDAAYASANLYLDLLAARGSKLGAGRVISINWDRWQGIGQAVRFEARHESRTRQRLLGGIPVREGLEVLEAILGDTRISHVAVSLRDPRRSIQEPEGTTGVQSPSPVIEQQVRPVLGTGYVAPRNPTQSKLCSIWQEVLGLQSIGIEDDFYELGGDSLIAIQVVSRVRESFRIEVAVRQLFEAPTVLDFARRIEEALGSKDGSSAAGPMEEGTI